MAALFAQIGAVFAAHAFKWGLGLLLLLVSAGGGFVWGEAHATAVAIKAASAEAAARVAAAQKQDQALIANYLNQLNEQKLRGDELAASLAQSQTKLAAATQAARKALAHAVPDNPVCDLTAAAVSVLRTQPARQ